MKAKTQFGIQKRKVRVCRIMKNYYDTRFHNYIRKAHQGNIASHVMESTFCKICAVPNNVFKVCNPSQWLWPSILDFPVILWMKLPVDDRIHSYNVKQHIC